MTHLPVNRGMNALERMKYLTAIAQRTWPEAVVSLTYKPTYGHRARLVADVHTDEFIEDSGWRDTDHRALDEIERVLTDDQGDVR